MDSVRFSLLVTVYNTERYLGDFFCSVLAQTYQNFEAVVIDDGSTDGSGRIADDYAERDSRIKVWHTSNTGVLRARKTAQDKATGDYLLNVDSDDLLEPNMLEALASAIGRHRCDMVLFDFTAFDPNGMERTETYYDSERVFEGAAKEEIFRLLLTTRINSLWTKCYAEKIAQTELDYDRFHGLHHGEDLLQSAYLLYNAEKIVYINTALYRYRSGIGNSARFDRDSFAKASTVLDVILGLLETLGFLTAETEAELCRMCRKQMNNAIGLMVKSGVQFSEAVRILKATEGSTLFKGAASSEADRFFSKGQNFKFALLRKKRYRFLLAVQTVRQKLFNRA